jgi:hypothetical protein
VEYLSKAEGTPYSVWWHGNDFARSQAFNKSVDFMVPNLREYEYLVRTMKDLGYEPTTASGWKKTGGIFQFDIFREHRIHTTELLVSPLEEGRHTLLKEYSHLYIGVLNDYDLISSKLMRGTSVDFDDCLNLVAAHRGDIDIEELVEHFNELVSYDVSVDRIRPHMESFLETLKDRGLL